MSKPFTIKTRSGEVQCNAAMCKFFRLMKNKSSSNSNDAEQRTPDAFCGKYRKNINFKNGYKAICEEK